MARDKKETVPFHEEARLERAIDRERAFLAQIKAMIEAAVIVHTKPALDAARRTERLVSDLARRVDTMGAIATTSAAGVENINSVLTARLLIADGQDRRIERLLEIIDGVITPPAETPPQPDPDPTPPRPTPPDRGGNDGSAGSE